MQAVTMIDELPSLEELELQHASMENMSGSPNVPHQYDKYIRPTHRMDSQSGMMRMEQYNNYGHPPQHNLDQGQMAPPPPPPPNPVHSISCLEVADHVKGCPICSRFYNNDKTVYIIVIIVLVIICLLLLKRVLNV